MKSFVPLLILSCMMCPSGHSAPYNKKNLDMDRGLSNNYVMSVTQDSRGFLWVATESGLNRFDGKNFKNYRKGAPDSAGAVSVSANELNKVYADRYDPVIWVATQRGGLNMFDVHTEEFTHFRHSPADSAGIITDDITDVRNSADGNLWVSTYHRGVEYFDKSSGTFTHYNTATLQGLASDNVWSVAEDSGGNLYIGHVSDGLSIVSLADMRVRCYRHDPGDARSLPGNTVQTVYVDELDNVWLGTDNGLAVLRPGEEAFTVFRNSPSDKNSLSADYIYDISLIDGRLWVCTENGGVSIADRDALLSSRTGEALFESISEGDSPYSLSGKTARTAFRDSFGNVWIGTYGEGVDFISHIPFYFSSWSYSPVTAPGDGSYTLSSKTAWGICADDLGGVWIGTDGTGIDMFDSGGRYRSFTKGKGHLRDDAVLAAMKDSGGNLWFGTFASGVSVYSPGKGGFSQPFADEGLRNVRCLFEDRDKDIWIGTGNGLYRANKGWDGVKKYTAADSGLHEDNVRAVCQDQGGNLWIGTFGQGIGVFTPEMKHIATIDVGDGYLRSNTIHHLYTDNRGMVWAATGEGLALFPDPGRPDSLRLFTETEGFVNSNIKAIAEDSSGTIWVSTDGGISRLTPSQWQIHNYDRFDGVPSGTFMSGSVTRSPDGRLFFGSQNGLCVFDPGNIPSNIDLPGIILSAMKVYNYDRVGGEPAELLASGQITLKHFQNSFALTFNVPDHALADIVEYSYRLTGAGDQWYTMNSYEGNTVDFRNLAPGSYVFEVRARVRNQPWADDIESLDIHIRPPLWLSWWAKTLYVVAALAVLIVILGFYKRKLDLENKLVLEKNDHERKQELYDERMRFFTNITHELRSPLTLIVGPLEDIQEDGTTPPKFAARIGLIYKSANRLLELINQILEFRKTETQNKKLSIMKADLGDIVRECVLKYRELNMNPRVNISGVIESGDTVFNFDKGAVTMMIDNLLSNSVKFTSEGDITVTLRDRQGDGGGYAEIEVRDTGCGIAAGEVDKIFERYYQAGNSDKVGTGIGLALVSNLVALHGGTINADSRPGEYTSIVITLPKEAFPDDAAAPVKPEARPGGEAAGSRESGEEKQNIILVVEDDDDIRGYICQSLPGFKILQARDGQEGLELARQNIPDIIISDIMMPGVDGITMSNELKQDLRTSHIPLIFLTAKDSIEDRTEGYRAKADSYITKPFSATLLKSRVDNILERRRELAESISNNSHDKGRILKESLGALDSEFINRVSSLIEENIDSDKIEVNFLAENMHMSHSTFYRKIKALTDITPNEFIRKIRMRRAEQLLLTGKYNISEVSYMVGISSVQYFRQCFKEEFGMTPTDYIRKLSGQGV